MHRHSNRFEAGGDRLRVRSREHTGSEKNDEEPVRFGDLVRLPPRQFETSPDQPALVVSLKTLTSSTLN